MNIRDLTALPEGEQQQKGYFHTLSEIRHQPATWRDTCERMIAASPALEKTLAGIQSIVLTGSGSSQYAGECARLVLQKELGVTTDVVGGGTLLTHRAAVLPPQRPGLLISIARSGDSPESVAAASQVLAAEPEFRHLVITCNQAGKLAVTYGDDPRGQVVVLDDRTNDRSLVMTSSFTNMVLASRFLGIRREPQRYRALCGKLSRTCEAILEQSDALARLATAGFRRVIYLGSGSRFGAARESSLKMLEMTAGRVATICETYLGVRHGPLSYIHDDTLVVCFFSSDPLLRAYEADLLRELDRKRLGMAKVVVGENVPGELLRAGDLAVECPGLSEIGDENAPVLDTVVGQLLGTLRCMVEGLRPDSPSEGGVINRVVESFPLHGAGQVQ